MPRPAPSVCTALSDRAKSRNKADPCMPITRRALCEPTHRSVQSGLRWCASFVPEKGQSFLFRLTFHRHCEQLVRSPTLPAHFGRLRLEGADEPARHGNSGLERMSQRTRAQRQAECLAVPHCVFHTYGLEVLFEQPGQLLARVVALVIGVVVLDELTVRR